jgi:hypothetical protein
LPVTIVAFAHNFVMQPVLPRVRVDLRTPLHVLSCN